MTKIMQTNDAQTVCFKNILKAIGKRIGFQPFTKLIDTNIVKIPLQAKK